MTVHLIAIVIVLLAALFYIASATKLDLSFESPFSEVDWAGNKIVGINWKNFGSTVVNSNFIRLTPDRQSKKGAMWSRSPLGVPSFSAILKFRIAGQGKNFFGDGLAMWIVSDSDYVDGDLHGFSEKFYGIGIIFDTFKNTEHLSAHRDVTILINDGEKTFELMTQDIQGCNTNVRYHNDRGDFSVTDAARMKITLKDNSLALQVDPKNSGEWADCVTIANTGLEPNWLVESHIGFTGTTGQLADNHDILSLEAFSDDDVMHLAEMNRTSKRHFNSGAGMPIEDRLHRLEEAMNTLLEKMEYNDHHLEHELVSIDDHLKSMVGKLEKKEDESQSRIGVIEQELKKEFGKSTDEKVRKAEESIQAMLDRKMKDFHGKLNLVSAKATEIEGSSNSWFYPFMFLILLQVVAAVGIYFFYKNLAKRHIL